MNHTGGILSALLPGKKDWTTVHITGAKKKGTISRRMVLALKRLVVRPALAKAEHRDRFTC